jgi:hypothetical protein
LARRLPKINREILKIIKNKFNKNNIEETFNHIIILLLPGIIHELNNSQAIVDGYLQFLTGKIPIKEEKKTVFAQKINNATSDITLIFKALTMLISQKDIEFPTSVSEILSSFKSTLKIQIKKNLKIESKFILDYDGLIKIKPGNIICSMLIIILFFLSETKETGEFLFSIKKEEDLIKFSLNFKNLYKFDIEDYREILTFTKDACIDSKGIFNFEKNENSELKLEFMFTQDEGNKVLKL